MTFRIVCHFNPLTLPTFPHFIKILLGKRLFESASLEQAVSPVSNVRPTLSRRRLLHGAASFTALSLIQGCGYAANANYHPPSGNQLPLASGPVVQGSLSVIRNTSSHHSAALHGFELREVRHEL